MSVHISRHYNHDHRHRRRHRCVYYNNPLANVLQEDSFCAGLLRRTIPGRRSGKSYKEKAMGKKDLWVKSYILGNTVAGKREERKEIRLFENFDAFRKENSNYNNNDDTKTVGGQLSLNNCSKVIKIILEILDSTS